MGGARGTTLRLGLLGVLAGLFSSAPAWAEAPPTFEQDVRPLLAARCVVCHNRKKVDDADVSGGLALDSYEATLEGAAGRKVVVAGKAAESELVRRVVEADEDRRMPLSDRPLTEPQRALLRRWVEAGLPRGEPVASAVASVSPARARRIVRSLDVALPVEAKVPPGVEGFGPGGALQVVLKVGPLPAVSALAFRGDARLLAVGTHGAAVVWDLAEARPAAVLADQPGPVLALTFSRDGRRLAVGSGAPARSGTVRLYDVPGATLLAEFEGHADAVSALAFRPDGAQLASASFDQTVRLWDLGAGRPAGVFRGHSDFVQDLAYTPDGASLLSASKDRTIKRIDVRTLKEVRTYSGHDADVLALAVRPAGATFVTAGLEPQLRWWTVEGDTPKRTVGGHGGPVHALAFARDGRRLLSAGGDGTVRLWDGASGAFLRVLPGPSEWQYAVALSDDGRLAAAGGWDGVARLWEAENGRLLGTFLQPPSPDGARPDWLAVVPSGYLTASPGLRPLLRWRVGATEVPAPVPLSVFLKPDEVARGLRGEAVTPAAYPRRR